MNNSTAKVTFHFLDVKFPFRNRTRLKNFLVKMFESEGKEVESLQYIFCSDEHLLQMNRDFLQHDYYTDIITFDLSTAKNDPTAGELYISIDRVKDNAINFDSSFERELHRVVFHGVLHLIGYKDKSEKDQKLMRSKEDEYLNIYFS